MIVNRYLQRNIHLGTLGALVVLVSLGLFFMFVRELDDIGQGSYGARQALLYILLSAPGKVVEFMPLAALIGSMLSLGALAANSEIIALQASGITLRRIAVAVLQAAAVLALISFLLADWVVPASESGARRMKALAEERATALSPGESLWIKDDRHVVHVKQMLPNGYARGVEIYLLDARGRLQSVTRAEHALPRANGWELRKVSLSKFGADGVSTERFERTDYRGRLSQELLQVMLYEPRWMSSGALSVYVEFLDNNGLDARVERLILWQKRLQPLTIIIMCLLALPFVIGAQRQAGAGHRLLLGILLGLAFVVAERVLVQVGNQFALDVALVALLPNLVFLALAAYLFVRRQSHGIGFTLASISRQR